MAKGTGSERSAAKATRPPRNDLNALHSFCGPNLSKMVESDIIPRLLMAHRNDRWSPPRRAERMVEPASSLSADEIARFAALPLQLETGDLLDAIEQYLSRGVAVEQIFIELLAPSARKLGELWEADECDFVDVTMGLWRLQEVMRVVAMRSPVILHTIMAPRSALFAPIPGDQHSFGALMIDEVFTRAGWESEVLFEPKRPQLLEIVARRAFDLVGLTVTNDCPSGDLADLISAIRSVSRNPDIRVLIGGRAVNIDPTLYVAAGADGTAIDAVSAVVLAEQLLAESRSALCQN